ncbi:hypothetical protein LJK88_14345 [Paenibacillus sp. P26]|nr:hypothetical protein LJK88_14345 [Paenibacillus sp. P26]UUZ96921.1 hypothetical protein LJK87_23380 [Paenibacillus sp. P25]
MLDRIEPNRNGIFYPRHIQYEINGRTYDNNLISLIYVNSIGKIMSGAMIVNLDQQVLQSMVMNGAGGKSFQSMILNKQGTVISHSNSAMINASLAGEDDVRQIQSSDSPRGSLEMTKNGRSYRISYIKSDSLGWTFIGVIDYESLLSQVKEMKRFILTVTGVMLLFVVLLGGFFTGWIYGPIHRLMMNVRNLPVGGEDVQGVSELDLLGGTITYLEHKIHDLQRSVADYQSAKRHEVLGSLTAGGWSNEAEIRKRLEKVGVTWEYNRFIAVMLKIDSYRKLSAAYKPSDIALFKYAISNIATEVGSGRFTVVCYDCGEDGVAMIANLPDGSHEPVQELAEVLRDIQLHIHKFLKLSVTVSIGPFVRSMADIKTSWETARKASLYRLIMGKGAIIDSSIEETRESLQDSQVGGLEKQIMDRLKLGDMDKVEKAVSQFIGYVQSASFDEMMLSFTQLLISTARTMKAMVAADPKELTLDIGTLCGQLGQWETIGEIETWYLGLCEKAASLRDSQAQHKNKWIVDKILRYIDEHYADSNLTVETLVEAGACR